MIVAVIFVYDALIYVDRGVGKSSHGPVINRSEYYLQDPFTNEKSHQPLRGICVVSVSDRCVD